MQEVDKKIVESAWNEDQNGKRWEDYDTILCPDGTVIDMQQLLDDQHRAKAGLVHIAPSLGGFLSRLRFIYTFRVQTQATDGYNIFVNPQFTWKMNLAEKVFVMAHEVMHCLLNHMRRGRGHDHMKSNIAADYECNITLVETGITKEAVIKKLDGYVDQKYKDWSYEKIYDDISSASGDTMDNQDQSGQAKKNQQGQQGQGSGSGQGQQQQYSDDYKRGWAQAIEDIKSGKIKL